MRRNPTVAPEDVSWRTKGFIPFECEGEVAGWLRPSFASVLRRWPEYFEATDDRVALSTRLQTPGARTDALAACARELARGGIVLGWRDERYTIWSQHDGARLFDIERAAMRCFGLVAHAAHLNGYADDGAAVRMWIARRSLSKSVDPGKLDNLVGGGVAVGYTVWETLLKECGEEAGIPRALATAAQPRGSLWSAHEVAGGLHRERIFVYDLALPEAFTPKNCDGEVAEFYLMTLRDVSTVIGGGEFSAEAGLVAGDFLYRGGVMSGEPGRGWVPHPPRR